MKMYHVMSFLKLEYSFADIVDFFRGNLRYQAYYSKYFKWLIRTHILEQIDHRIVVMDRDCYNNGSCKVCGCNTTHLQMANKACEGDCYLPLMKRKEWRKFRIELRFQMIAHDLNLSEANKKLMKEYVE